MTANNSPSSKLPLSVMGKVGLMGSDGESQRLGKVIARGDGSEEKKVKVEKRRMGRAQRKTLCENKREERSSYEARLGG